MVKFRPFGAAALQRCSHFLQYSQPLVCWEARSCQFDTYCIHNKGVCAKLNVSCDIRIHMTVQKWNNLWKNAILVRSFKLPAIEKYFNAILWKLHNKLKPTTCFLHKKWPSKYVHLFTLYIFTVKAETGCCIEYFSKLLKCVMCG